MANTTRILDIRNTGHLSEEAEDYLAALIALGCQEPVKHYLAQAAANDFGWDASLLQELVLAGCVSMTTARAPGCVSSSEWLCGIFTSGSELKIDHLHIMMFFVNSKFSVEQLQNEEYVSGKSLWASAPEPLRRLLDFLDDAAVAGENVQVILPHVQNLDDLPDKAMSVEELKKLVRFEWK